MILFFQSFKSRSYKFTGSFFAAVIVNIFALQEWRNFFVSNC